MKPSLIDDLDNHIIRNFFSIVLGISLGIIYMRLNHNTTIIKSENINTYNEMENSFFKSVDKCYRKKKS